MPYAERIADQTAAHYDALRQRRVPLILSWLMTLRFHEHLTRTVLLDDQFEVAVGALIAPVAEDT